MQAEVQFDNSCLTDDRQRPSRRAIASIELTAARRS